MDEHQAVNLLLLDTLDLDDIVMMMARIAVEVIGSIEDGDEEFYTGVPWHVVNINLDNYLTMGDPSFKLHFRMNRSRFEALVGVIYRHLQTTGRMQRERTPLEFIVMPVLWIMATPDSFRSVALKFQMRPGTLHYHYLYIIECLREMAGDYIVWPSAQERREIKDYFEDATGFPGIVGCIDGTHHQILAPRYQKNRYINRHHVHSVNTQCVCVCVCDHRLLVRDLYVGEPGSVHDSRVFRRSPLSTNLLENEEMIGFDEHLLGDGGYLLTNFLITPFRNNGHLTDLQRNFNRMHAQNRGTIENAFALKKGKWRRTFYLPAMHQEIVVDHIIASVVLHNFVILEGEEVEGLDDELREPLNDDENEDELYADDAGVNDDYPNIMGERDHPLLEEARLLGAEKRQHLMRVLPRRYF